MAANKITDLFLKRKEDRTPDDDVLPTDIAVNFVPSFCDLNGANAAARDATHIRLTLNATPPVAVLKNLTDPIMVAGLAKHIGEAKNALNKNNDDNVLDPPLGLRGKIDDAVAGVVRYLGGKKSKSKKQLKSKKQKKIKSVRRR